jgi:dipeptidyl aminopeptidase/acylaminoacyl peptidase
MLSAERDGDLDVYAAMSGALVDLTRNNVGDAAAVLAPDGQHVALARAGRVFVVDRRGGSEFIGAGAPVAFSNDGRLAIVTARFVLQIAVRTGRGEWKLRTVRHAEGGYRLSWSADGRRIVYVDGWSDFGTIHVIDAKRGKRLARTFQQYDVDAGVVWSPTGDFAYGSDFTNPSQVIVRDSDEKLVGRVKVTGDPWAIGWSPRGVLTFSGQTGLYVATGSHARRIARGPIQTFAW